MTRPLAEQLAQYFTVMEGQEHVVPPELLAPVLAEFFANRNDARHRTESRKE